MFQKYVCWARMVWAYYNVAIDTVRIWLYFRWAEKLFKYRIKGSDDRKCTCVSLGNDMLIDMSNRRIGEIISFLKSTASCGMELYVQSNRQCSKFTS